MDCSDDIWLAKPAPRYTSYPTAPHFHNGVGAREYLAMLSGISADDNISLYLHVPFCNSLCLYCGCHTSITKRPERIQDYINALKMELALHAGCMSGKCSVSHLHFGGGSPNIMSGRQLEDLFVALNNAFDLASCAELAMELDPRLVDARQIETLAACGVNRISLGVQDFNNEVQAAVNRKQPYAMVSAVCEKARAVGIRNINFDLMYGLPLQTPKSIEDTMYKALKLNPDRISFFSYAHVPQLKKHQAELEKYGLPDKYNLLKMEDIGRNVILSSGYLAIGMDHFAKPDDSLAVALNRHMLHRNFQGYTDDAARTMLGLGASSIGRSATGYFQNERDIERYQHIINSNDFATTRGVAVNEDDILRASIIENLMCYMECDVPGNLSGADVILDALGPFIAAGIVEFSDGKVSLLSPHRMAIRAVCQIFDLYAAKPVAAQSKIA